MQLTSAEWDVMNVLWSKEDGLPLGEITEKLRDAHAWSKNTVHTYLTRMEKKGLVKIDRSLPAPYRAAVSKEECARSERKDFLKRVYGGAEGELIVAFLKESKISQKEIDRLKKLLDEMEV